MKTGHAEEVLFFYWYVSEKETDRIFSVMLTSIFRVRGCGRDHSALLQIKTWNPKCIAHISFLLLVCNTVVTRFFVNNIILGLKPQMTQGPQVWHTLCVLRPGDFYGLKCCWQDWWVSPRHYTVQTFNHVCEECSKAISQTLSGFCSLPQKRSQQFAACQSDRGSDFLLLRQLIQKLVVCRPLAAIFNSAFSGQSFCVVFLAFCYQKKEISTDVLKYFTMKGKLLM